MAVESANRSGRLDTVMMELLHDKHLFSSEHLLPFL